jgi:hypothetical protein
LPESERENADHDYLMTDIFEWLPVRFRLLAQLAEDGDPVDDCTVAFPAHRRWVDMGVELTGASQRSPRPE